MKASIRFYLPKTALNPTVNKEKGRENLVDFEAEMVSDGAYLFQRTIASMGGGVYTFADMEKTERDKQIERLWSMVERGVESDGACYDDDDSDLDDARDAINQLQDILR